MSIKALQDYTYVSKYARYNKKARRRETWSEAVDRVKEMHLRKYPHVADEIEWAFDLVKHKRVLGSQRALQFGGSPIEQKNARIYNCCVSFCDRVRMFQETFWLLLCGCGTGFSVQKHHVAKLPDFFDLSSDKRTKRTFIIPDSIEGWSDALGILLATYMPHEEFPDWGGYEVNFDYSEIRKAGSVLASGVGKAPGPEPLRRSLEIIRTLMDKRVSEGHAGLRSIDAYDIIMHASDAVLSGGVRRSATICLFSFDDAEMVSAKTGNWFIDNPQRARSNNSALLIRGEVTFRQFEELMKSVKQFGEPGFVWSDSTELCVNPCVTGDTLVATTDGLRFVSDLLGKSFSARVDGGDYASTDVGFWKTGHKQVLNLTLASGRQVSVTPDHKMLTTVGWKTANDVSYEDEIVVHNHRAAVVDEYDSCEFARGYCLGNFLADGNVSKHAAQMKWWGERQDEYRSDAIGLLTQAGWKNPRHAEDAHGAAIYSSLESVKLYEFASAKGCIGETGKVFSREAAAGSWSYLAGLVAGYFDGDGTVAANPQKGSSLRIWSVSLDNLRQLQIILSGLGVYSNIYEDRIGEGSRLMPDGHGGYKSYDCQAGHELVISCDNIERFAEVVPIRNEEKKKKIARIIAERKRQPNRTHFVDHVVRKEIAPAQDVYDCTVPEMSAFDANGLYVHNCVEIGMWPVHWKTGKSGWQMCVAGDTKLLLESGRAEIASLVGEKVKVWNGEKWSEVVPFITGHNRELYRVHLSDGSYLDCTDNHRWLVKTRFQKKYSEVETRELMNFSRHAIHTPRAGVSCESGIAEPMAYNYGFMLGDGTARIGHAPSARLYKGDRTLELIGSRTGPHVNEYGTEYENFSFSGLDNELSIEMKSHDRLPDQVFSWDVNSAASFMSGWIDADGSQANRGCRLYGTEGRLRDAQLLLTKIGVNCSVNLMSAKGERTNKGVRNQDVWYLQIADARKLAPGRLETADGKVHNGKGKFQVVRYVEKLPGLHTTYCVTEPELHQCLFNNVLTKQCNLCEINGRRIKTKEDFALAAKAGAIIGTLQAGYTDFDYLGQTTKEIVEREALLGVSITGMMDNPDVIFDQAIQREMAQLVLDTNAIFAKKIGIRPAARATCVKPAGTTSCILGSASGIHPHHAKRYFRRIQGNYMEAPLQYFKQHNYIATEKSVWSANKTDEVITFCVEVPDGAKTKNQLSAVTLLEYVKDTQQNWVAFGKRAESCTQPWLTHNVSNTINVRPDEWDDVTKYIYDNRSFFAGIALLPTSGDLDYPQAPMCTVHNAKEIVGIYGEGSLFASGLIVDGLRAFDNNLWAACEAVNGLGDPLTEPLLPEGASESVPLDTFGMESTNSMLEYKSYKARLREWSEKKDFIRRAHQFANRYFLGDIRKMAYCLKEVYNWKQWQDLTREYKDVDYSLMTEEQDETKVQQEWACSGQSCDMR